MGKVLCGGSILTPWPDPVYIGKIYGFRVNRVRRVGGVWRLETDKGAFALKKAPLPRAASFLRVAEKRLRQHGFDRFPAYVCTRQNEPECQAPSGERYVLRTWLAGEAPILDMEHKHDLERTAGCVATLHEAGKDCPGKTAGETWQRRIPAMTDAIGLFATSGEPRGRFARLYQGHIAAALEEAETSLLMLKDAEDTAADGFLGFCHGDLAPNNALVLGEHIFLLDFDRAEINTQVYDLATLIRRVASASGWQPSIGEIILGAYQRLQPLAPAEIRLLGAFLHWPQQFWRLGHQYYVEKLARSERYFCDQLWHWSSQSAARRLFLHRIRLVSQQA